MKKLMCLALALLMLLSSAAATAETVGGWCIPEETFVSDDAAGAFEKAVGEDSELYPVALLGTQVVAGINYAVLCDAPGGYVIAYVYKALSGECEMVRVQNVAATEDELAGSWCKLEEEEPGEEVIEAITDAINKLIGIDVSEMYILTKQLVAGMNYGLLCRKATVTAEPVEGWALATVYVDLEGNASITDIQDLELSLSAE